MVSKIFSQQVSAALAITTIATVSGFTWSTSFSQSQTDPPSSKSSKTLKGHSAWVYAVAISPDGKTLASGSYNGLIKIWNLQTGQLIHNINGHSDAVESLAISSNGRILASGSWDHRIKLWNLDTGELIRTLSGHTDDVESVAFAPNGKTLASGSWDQTVKLWDVQTGNVIRTLNQNGSVRSVAISPDGQLVASGTEDGKMMIWDLKTGKLKTPLAAHNKALWSVAFSPDGKQVATGSYDRTIKLWNSQTGELLRTLAGHNNAVWSVAFSPDGQSIASGSYDRTIKLWNPQTGELRSTLSGHNKAVWSVAFNPVGQTLVSGSADETVKIWQISSQAQAQAKAAPPSIPSISELDTILSTQPEMISSTDIYSLTRKVYNQIHQAWQKPERSEENIVYRLGVASDGAILAYKSVKHAQSDLTLATLKKILLYKLVKRRPATNEPIVHFEVVFTKQGILEVTPWQGYKKFS